MILYHGSTVDIEHIDKYGAYWKMVLIKSDEHKQEGVFEIYTFPGDGSAPEKANGVAAQAAPRTARKITRNGQMFVQTETNTYSVTGQEVNIQ